MKKFLCAMFFGCCCLSLNAATLTASVDRNKMGEDETLNLTVSYDDSSIAGQPDLKGLQSNFEILGTSTNSQTRIINGSMESSKSWRYTLMPKRSGKLLIPSFELKGAFSEAIEIEVLSQNDVQKSIGTNRGDLFIEASVDKKQARVQEMITYTLKIYTSVNISRPKMEDLHLSGFMVEKLGESEYETRENGRGYYVLQYQYALFPSQSGQAVIPKTRYQIAQIISNGPRSRFNIPGFENTQARYLSTPDIHLEILPPLQSPTGHDWLVAEDVQIEDNWPAQQQIKQGDPITRRIEITALNTLASHLPPTPELSMKQLKDYPEAPELKNQRAGEKLQASRIENHAIVAVAPGNYTLPPITIHWWNSKTKSFKQSVLPARTLIVTPADDPIQPASDHSADEENIIQMGAQNDPPEHIASGTKMLKQGDNPVSAPWYLDPILWMTLTLMSLLANAALLFVLSKNKSARKPAGPSFGLMTSQKKEALKAVKQASRMHHAAQARSALLHWAQLQWPTESVYSLKQLAQQISQQTGDGHFDELARQLDNALYGQQNNWDGHAMLAYFEQPDFENKITGKSAKHHDEKNSLPGLYD